MAKKTNQDETVLDVEELYSKSEKFVDDNKKQLSLGLGAVAAVILVVIGYSSFDCGPQEPGCRRSFVHGGALLLQRQHRPRHVGRRRAPDWKKC